MNTGLARGMTNTVPNVVGMISNLENFISLCNTLNHERVILSKPMSPPWCMESYTVTHI